MLHGQLRHYYNFTSFLDRFNDGDDLKFSGKKVPELVGFVRYWIQSISVWGRYVSFENIKLSCIIGICSGRENFVHYFRRKTTNIFVNFG